MHARTSPGWLAWHEAESEMMTSYRLGWDDPGSPVFSASHAVREMAPIHDTVDSGDMQQVLSILAKDPQAVHTRGTVRACPAQPLRGGAAGTAIRPGCSGTP